MVNPRFEYWKTVNDHHFSHSYWRTSLSECLVHIYAQSGNAISPQSQRWKISKISIIVPVYNVEPYLEKFLRAIKLQTFQDFQVVFVYDDSEDNSLQILNTFVKEEGASKQYKILLNEFL